jgi:hypothetical protein
MKKLRLLYGFVLLSSTLFAQVPKEGQLSDTSYVLSSVVLGKDTIPLVQLRIADISGKKKKLTRQDKRDARLKRYVVKVYPYARLAGELFEAYQSELDSMPTEAQKSAFMKIAEDELRAEFEGELRRLTIMQGQILVKLVNRETDKTGYDIVKQMRGGLTAFFWQGIARLFGSNLKNTYDAEGEDKFIEQIVQDIENGLILVMPRKANTKAAQEQWKEQYYNKQQKKKRRKK